jgi:hypothetical protein
MRRAILISAGVSAVISTLVTTLVLSLVLPTAAGAQEARLHADQAISVGPQGVDRARMGLGPGLNSAVTVLGADGRVRALMGTGGPAATGGTEPETADVVVFAQDGTSIARLGTRNTPDSHAAGVNLVLSDMQGHPRLDMLVAEDGTPAIHMLDADGTVTWSAP